MRSLQTPDFPCGLAEVQLRDYGPLHPGEEGADFFVGERPEGSELKQPQGPAVLSCHPDGGPGRPGGAAVGNDRPFSILQKVSPNPDNSGTVSFDLSGKMADHPVRVGRGCPLSSLFIVHGSRDPEHVLSSERGQWSDDALLRVHGEG